jgi:NAD(P)-dependent dehydrogenase (short-subunit alcohol dehydrogenase family)
MSKIALVTGTSSGIGLSAAILLARAGFTTVATVRELERSEALRKRARREGVALDVRRLDVCDQASVDACADEVLAQYGKVDVLVNNAGAGHKGTLEQISVEEIQQNLDVNFFGPVRVTQALLPAMREVRSGRIVTVTSLNGVLGVPFNDAYNASKFAIEGLMEGLAPVVARFGVSVSLIEPGPVRTEFFATRDRAHAARATAGSDPYRPLLEAYDRAVNNRVSGAAQTGDDVARTIVEAATADTPHLRYQTSDFARAAVAQVRVDPTGDSIVAQMSKQIEG